MAHLCPVCRGKFDINKYRKNGRCSECEAEFDMDEAKQPKKVKDSIKKENSSARSRYTKVEKGQIEKPKISNDKAEPKKTAQAKGKKITAKGGNVQPDKAQQPTKPGVGEPEAREEPKAPAKLNPFQKKAAAAPSGIDNMAEEPAPTPASSAAGGEKPAPLIQSKPAFADANGGEAPPAGKARTPGAEEAPEPAEEYALADSPDEWAADEPAPAVDLPSDTWDVMDGWAEETIDEPIEPVGEPFENFAEAPYEELEKGPDWGDIYETPASEGSNIGGENPPVDTSASVVGAAGNPAPRSEEEFEFDDDWGEELTSPAVMLSGGGREDPGGGWEPFDEPASPPPPVKAPAGAAPEIHEPPSEGGPAKAGSTGAGAMGGPAPGNEADTGYDEDDPGGEGGGVEGEEGEEEEEEKPIILKVLDRIKPRASSRIRYEDEDDEGDEPAGEDEDAGGEEGDGEEEEEEDMPPAKKILSFFSRNKNTEKLENPDLDYTSNGDGYYDDVMPEGTEKEDRFILQIGIRIAAVVAALFTISDHERGRRPRQRRRS